MISWRLGALLGVTAGVAAVACGSSDVETGTGGGTGGAPSGGAGVGEACSEAKACRSGLKCTAGVCELGRSVPTGGSCVIAGECQDGNQCIAGRCTPSGEAAAGEGCQTDADCQSGLRCAIVGFGTQCGAEGTGDLGASCDVSGDCYAGLSCQAGSCAKPLPGDLGFGLPSFPGVQCSIGSSNPVRAYFEVPGATPAGDEGDFFRLPFPNDVRRKGGKLDLSGFPTPGDDLIGFDPVQLYVDAIERDETGWGAYPTVIFRFSGPIDFKQWQEASPVAWVDVTPGAPEYGLSAGLNWFASEGRSNFVCANWFGIRRPRGRPLQPGHVYAVYMTTDGLAKDGAAIERSPHLADLLKDAAPGDATLAAAHASFAPFRDYLSDQGIATSTILNASVITVGPHRDTMAALAAAVEAAPVPTASGWVKCGGGATSPCPQADGDRACGDGTGAFDEYHALVKLPIFQRGDAPYETEGGDVDTSAAVRTEDVCMALTVPKDTMPAEGWPLAIFAHGTGGSFRSHVRDDVAGVLSDVTTSAGAAKLAVLGIDQVQHGPRRGDSTKSPNDLFFNFANPRAARGNPLQGAVDQLALGRFAAALDVTAATTGGDAIKVNPSAIVLFGHSQGATHGSLALPYSSEIRAAVLSGNGASLMDALLTKTEPVNIAAAVPFVLADFDSKGKLNGGDKHPALSLVQHWIDPADPLNYAAIAGRFPEMGAVPKSIFQTYGLGDTFSPPATLATYAIAAELDLAAHDSSVGNEADAIGGKMPLSTPVAGNATVSGSTITLAVRQYGPPAGRDGHFVAFDVATANADVARFLGMAALGVTPAVGQ